MLDSFLFQFFDLVFKVFTKFCFLLLKTLDQLRFLLFITLSQFFFFFVLLFYLIVQSIDIVIRDSLKSFLLFNLSINLVIEFFYSVLMFSDHPLKLLFNLDQGVLQLLFSQLVTLFGLHSFGLFMPDFVLAFRCDDLQILFELLHCLLMLSCSNVYLVHQPVDFFLKLFLFFDQFAFEGFALFLLQW